jgi:cell division protein FtsL
MTKRKPPKALLSEKRAPRREPKDAPKAKAPSKAKGATKARPAGARKQETKARAPRNRGLSFGFLIFVFLFLAGTGVFMLVQHQYTVRCDLKTERLSSKIANEKSRQETLRLSIARLKSPGHVARIASDELGMGEPMGVIYLKYARDAKGNIVCQSTFEQRTSPAPPRAQEQKPAGDTQASVVEGPGGALTRR